MEFQPQFDSYSTSEEIAKDWLFIENVSLFEELELFRSFLVNY